MSLYPSNDTPEQAELRDVVAQALARHPGETVWGPLAGQMGLTGLAVAETDAGAGATLAEVAVVVEELGRALAPVPYLGTALAAHLVPSSHVDHGGLLDGSLRAAIVLDADVALRAQCLLGRATSVLDAVDADVFVVVSADRAVCVRAGDVVVERVGSLDPTRTLADVTFPDAPAVVLARRAEEVVAAARTLLAAESVGAAEACLTITCDYLRTREQFGRPLASFQALRHRCADVAADLGGARALVASAIRAVVEDRPLASMASVVAKLRATDAFFHAAAEMIQLHGGIGFTWEHPAHRYFKRAKSSQLVWGDRSTLRRAVADQVRARAADR